MSIFGNGKLPTIIKSSHIASTVYGLEQIAQNAFTGNYTGAPRPRYLFLVRFVRLGASQPVWLNGMTFAVRSLERPKMTPEIQVLNQYNKKRLVQTGIKYNPVNISFHDTTESAVMQMWNEYAKFYFGDFKQSSSKSWAYDVTSPQFQGGENGFGFSPNMTAGATASATSSYFFDHIECYQVFAGQYVQYDLVNPKISAFNPDSFDHSASEAHTIDMALEYETVVYHNGFVPAMISSNAFLNQVFHTTLPKTYDPFPPPSGIQTGNGKQNPAGGILSSILGLGATYLAGGKSQIGSAVKQIGTGVLGSFGTAIFGQNNPVSGAFASALPSIMNGKFSAANTANALYRGVAQNPSGITLGISSQQLNATTGSAAAFVNPAAPASIVSGLAAAGSQDTTAQNINVGYTPSATALGNINANSTSGAQVGVFSIPTPSVTTTVLPPDGDTYT